MTLYKIYNPKEEEVKIGKIVGFRDDSEDGDWICHMKIEFEDKGKIIPKEINIGNLKYFWEEGESVKLIISEESDQGIILLDLRQNIHFILLLLGGVAVFGYSVFKLITQAAY